uniref:Sulfatase domain-containing protein n=1 Tax=Ascaris lumbricoides TaxID=6252 RepID=A0A0M3HXT3_ASCLU
MYIWDIRCPPYYREFQQCSDHRQILPPDVLDCRNARNYAPFNFQTPGRASDISLLTLSGDHVDDWGTPRKTDIESQHFAGLLIQGRFPALKYLKDHSQIVEPHDTPFSTPAMGLRNAWHVAETAIYVLSDETQYCDEDHLTTQHFDHIHIST